MTGSATTFAWLIARIYAPAKSTLANMSDGASVAEYG
jgi:hypothetical protein